MRMMYIVFAIDNPPRMSRLLLMIKQEIYISFRLGRQSLLFGSVFILKWFLAV